MSGRGRWATLLSTLAFLLLAQPALQAATIVVDNTTCTLADAIDAANGDAPAGGCPAGSGDDVIELTADVTLTSALPIVATNLEIQGNGRVIERDAGAPPFRILHHLMNSLSLTNVTLRNGDADHGGGILSSGPLTLFSTTVIGNQASLDGGGIRSSGSLTLRNSLIAGNTAGSYGGGVWSANNLIAEQSTVSGNSAGVEAGGIFGGFTDMHHVTIAGNSAPPGSGGGVRGSGPGVLADALILADNEGGNCLGSVSVSGAPSFSDDATCPFGPNLTGFDTELRDNGGPTMTHALLAGSSAIDATGFDPDGDQRHFYRLDLAADAGAYEFGTEWIQLSFGLSDVGLFGTTSDGKTVFLTQEFASGALLFQTPINRNWETIELTEPLSLDPPGVVEAVITPDDKTIVFIAVAGGTQSVFSVPVGGGPITQLTSGTIQPDTLGVTSTGLHAFFFGDDDLFGTSARELWLAEIGVVGSAEQITKQGAFYGATTGVVFVAPTPDGARIVYASDTVNPQFELFSTFGSIDSNTRETFTLSTGVTYVSLAPDNDKMYFTADMFTSGLLNAHQTTIGSGSPEVQLNPPMDPAGIGVEFIELTLDGSRLGFTGELEGPGVTGSFTGSTAGPFPDTGFVSLSPPGVDAATFVNFNIDSDLAVWRGADFELWGGRADGSEPPYLLHDVPDGDGVGVFTGTGFPAANQRALYPLFPALAPPISMHSVRVDGTELPQQVSAPVPAGDSMWGADVPEPGERLVVMSSGPLADGGATIDRLQVGAVRADLPVQQANPTADLAGGEVGVLAYSSVPGENHVLFLQDLPGTTAPSLFAFGLMDSDGDGTSNTGDNCKFVAQAGQEPAPFPGSAVVAVDKTTFVWGGLFGSGSTSDVAWAKGSLPLTEIYTTSATGSVFDGNSMTDEDVPASGAGNWYLFKADCAGGDWGNAGRNEALP